MEDEIPVIMATEMRTVSLNERICFQIGDRLVFISAPYDGTNTRPMDLEAIVAYCREHPKARLLLWLNNVIKEL